MDTLSAGVAYSRSDIDQIIFRDSCLNRLDKLAAPGQIHKDMKGQKKSKQSKDGSWLMSQDDLESNQLIYTVYLTTFKCIIDDRVEHYYEVNQAIKKYVLNKGLIGLIRDMSEYYERFLRRHSIEPHSLWAPLLSEILSSEYSDLMPEQVAGEIFLFGKRFAPFGNHALAQDCEDEFWACEELNRIHDAQDLPNYWVSLIHQDSDWWFNGWEDGIYGPDPFVSNYGTDAEKYEHVHQELFISPNSIQTTCKCRTCKTVALYSYLGLRVPILSEQQEHEIVDSLEQDRLRMLARSWKRSHTDASRFEMQLALDRIGSQFCVGAVVPKNWKSYRMVAPDHPLYYHLQMQVERKLRNVIKDAWIAPADHDRLSRFIPRIYRRKVGRYAMSYVVYALKKTYKTEGHTRMYDLENVCPIDDQSSQRRKAQTGSVDGTIDTFDLSSASDLHRKLLVAELYPYHVASELLRAVPYCMIINGKAESLSMFAPMGSPLTFRTMQLTLVRILYTVTLTVARWNGWDVNRTMAALERMGVFGDDITCDSAVSETLLHVLEIFGFKVNVKKSCVDQAEPRFREACGGDYLGGVCVSPQYWPRKRIDLRGSNLQTFSTNGWTGEVENPVTALVSMSKNIAYFSPSANSYLNQVCQQLEPKLTTSPIGSSLPDLWSRFPLMKTKWKNKYAYIWYTKTEHLADRGLHQVLVRSDCAVGLSEQNGWTPEFRNWTEEEFLQHIHESANWDESSKCLIVDHDGILSAISEKEILESFAGEDLTCGPKVEFKPMDPQLHAKRCGVAKYLLRHNIDYTPIVEYVFRQQFYCDGPSYQDGLDKLLGISERRNPDSIFGEPKLTWKKAIR